MKNVGKISVVLPCYRAEAFVGDMIGDVLRQTYTDWELLVVSNGAGQQRQLSVINTFAAKDPRVKVLKVEEGGLSNARNVGISKATGSWLTFVDADDRLDDCHLERLADGTRDDVDIVVGGISFVEQRGSNNYVKIKLEEGHGVDDYFVRQSDLIQNATWNKLFRKSVLNNVSGGVV